MASSDKAPGVPSIEATAVGGIRVSFGHAPMDAMTAEYPAVCESAKGALPPQSPDVPSIEATAVGGIRVSYDRAPMDAMTAEYPAVCTARSATPPLGATTGFATSNLDATVFMPAVECAPSRPSHMQRIDRAVAFLRTAQEGVAALERPALRDAYELLSLMREQLVARRVVVDLDQLLNQWLRHRGESGTEEGSTE